ncbi:MAG: hypothetical protein JWO38_5039, partial [Gemmataceae bacterium]|nr:hypothetical protein [Gemmataceae bacterium]
MGRKKELVRLAVERGELTGEEAATILKQPYTPPSPLPRPTRAAAYAPAPTSVPTPASPTPPSPPPPNATSAPSDDGRQSALDAYRAGYRGSLRQGRGGDAARAAGVLALHEGGYEAEAYGAYHRFEQRPVVRDQARARMSVEAERQAERERRAAEYRAANPAPVVNPRVRGPAERGPGEVTPQEFLKTVTEDPEAKRIRAHQQEQLDRARKQHGEFFGVPENEGRCIQIERNARGLAGEAKFAAEQQRRQESAEHVDPLITAAGNRKLRADPFFKNGDPNAVHSVSNAQVAKQYGYGTESLADLTVGRFRTSVTQAGGPALLSQQTMAEKAAEAHAKVEQELTRGIERQIKALNPAITATEARRKAEEFAQKALTENVAVLRNKKGDVVGTAALGAELTAQGKYAAGKGAFSRTFSERTGAVGRALSGAVERVGGGGTLGTLAFLTAAPMVGEHIGPAQDDYKTAVATGNTSGVRTRAAAGSALGMAATGAGIGLMFGPWGAAIGAAAGAAAGLAHGLSEANREIREAKLGEALGKLAELLQHTGESISAGALNQHLNTVRSEVETKSLDTAQRSWWNPRAWFSGTDPSELAAVRGKETRAAFGGQAGAMVNTLSRQAEKLARDNPDVNTSELGKNLGQDPVAASLMRVASEVRGVPVGQVLKEFTQTIETAQRQIKTQREIEKGRRAAEQSADALSRLADAVTNAAVSTQKFETSLLALSGAFSGQGGAIRVGNGLSNGFAQFGSGTGAEFKRSTDILSAALGPAGSMFIKQSNATDQVSRELPSVLNTLGKSEGEFSTDEARKLLQNRLLPGMNEDQQKEALKNNPELKAAIESVIGELVKANENNKDGGLKKRLREDPGKVAEEVAASSVSSRKEYAQKMSRDIEENAQKFVEGLAQARTMLVAIGESQDKAAELRLAGRRVGADIQADRTGRNATDLLSLHDLNAPFQDRQERLTGFQGEAANDPDAIAARLRDVTSRVTGAAAARDAAVGNKDEFAKRAGDLDKLTGEANHLQTALRTLANASVRAAGIQEKLNAATANRDSRLGYAEKFISSSPEQQM